MTPSNSPEPTKPIGYRCPRCDFISRHEVNVAKHMEEDCDTSNSPDDAQGEDELREKATRNFYVFHATSQAGWQNIKSTGELRPYLPTSPYPRDSLVYFAYSPVRALEHGTVLLAVKVKDIKDKFYLGASEWQLGTPHPVPLEKIELIDAGEQARQELLDELEHDMQFSMSKVGMYTAVSVRGFITTHRAAPIEEDKKTKEK